MNKREYLLDVFTAKRLTIIKEVADYRSDAVLQISMLCDSSRKERCKV